MTEGALYTATIWALLPWTVLASVVGVLLLTGPRIVRLVILWLAVLAATSWLAMIGMAHAAVWNVDGACATPGDGTTMTCSGAHAPFNLIGVGVEAMNPGDTLNVRGPHDAFNGIYREGVYLTSNRPAGVPHGKALDCHTARCAIQGFNGERPIVQAARLHADWIHVSGTVGGADEVFRRPMELAEDAGRSPNFVEDTAHIRGGSEANADALRDTYQLFTNHPAAGADAPEGNVDLPYSTHTGTGISNNGDNDAAPADGYWSYCTAAATNGCVANNIYVNPPGSDSPATTILVPALFNAFFLEFPTKTVTVQDMDFGWSRMMGGDVGRGDPSHTHEDLIFRRDHFKHYRQKGLIGHLDLNILLEDTTFSYCGRGDSFNSGSGDTCYGNRFFGATGGVLRTTPGGPTMYQYLGTNGNWRFSANGQTGGPNQGPGAGLADFLDAPWNGPVPTGTPSQGAHTQNFSRGHGIDLKQTNGDGVTDCSGFLIDGIEAHQVEDEVFFIDTTTDSCVQDTFVHEVGHAYGMSNFTPSPLTGCVPPYRGGLAGSICFGSNNIARGNIFLNDGLNRNDLSTLIVCGTSMAERQTAAEELKPTFRGYNNDFENVGWAGVITGGASTNCFHQTTDPDWIDIQNNSWNGVNAATGAQCQAGSASGGCRDLVVMNVCNPAAACPSWWVTTYGSRPCCTHGINVTNNIFNGASEPIAITPAISTATNVLFDYNLYGGAPACLTTCAGVPCDATNLLIRDNAVMPALGTSGTTSGGACRTLPAFQGVHPTDEVHGFEGSPAYVSATNLDLTASSDAINHGVTETFFSSDIHNGGRPAPGSSIWDIGAMEFGAVTTSSTTTTSTTSTTTTSGATTSTTSTTTTTGGSTTSTTCPNFACTVVLGFSQTGMWYLGPPNGAPTAIFEPLVGDAQWQLRAAAGSGVAWMDPTFAGWTDPNALFSPCVTNSANPNRVVINVSIASGIPSVATWVNDMQAEIVTTIGPRACISAGVPLPCCTAPATGTCPFQYTNTTQVILQPVVGGPNNQVCQFPVNSGTCSTGGSCSDNSDCSGGGTCSGANPVHASRIHPDIDTAIAQVVAADLTGQVFAGISPEVRTCADYADNTGHICTPGFDSCGSLDARSPLATTIGNYYVATQFGCGATTTTTTTTNPGSTTTTTSTTTTSTTTSTTTTSTTTTSTTTSTTLPPHGFICTGCTCTGCKLF